MNSRINEARAFAERIKAMGFAVYLAENREYGFITDDTESRVLSFSFSLGSRLSGNYGPPSTQSGTGWSMERSPESLLTAEDVRQALYASPPDWVRRNGIGWKYLSTVKQYMDAYHRSSRFERV